MADEAKRAAGTLPGGLRTGLAWRLALNSRAALPLRRSPRGVPVDEAAQPDLYALVRDAARFAGLAVPSRVRLCGDATVWASRRTLRVGIPLIRALPADQLAAVVVHALAVADHPRSWLVRQVYPLWIDAVSEFALAEFDDDPDVPHWAHRRAETLDGFGRAVSARADAAAIAAVGRRAAVDGLAAAAIVTAEFVTVAGEVVRAGGRRRIRDLDEHWLAHIGAGRNDAAWDDADVAALAATHPTIADDLRACPMRLDAPRRCVRLYPLSTRQRRRLSRPTAPRSPRPPGSPT